LPPSAVYSIESSSVYPTAAAAAQQQQSAAPTAAPRVQRSLNPASIVNQPLPEIPVQASSNMTTPATQTKISAQPLCAANLGQYRSLQRPQAAAQQKLQLATQQQQQQQPPSLPP